MGIRNIIVVLALLCVCIWDVDQARGQHLSKIELTRGIGSVSERNMVKSTLDRFMSDINEAYYSGTTIGLGMNYLERDAREDLRDIWDKAPFYFVNTTFKSSLIKRPEGGYEVRGIPVRNKRSPSVMYFGIRVTMEGAVSGIGYSLEEEMIEEVLGASTEIEDYNRRVLLLDFIEEYKNAYHDKNIEYVKKIFSDDALIIVGKVLDTVKSDSDGLLTGIEPTVVELMRLNKREYITRLASVFNATENIEVSFEEVEIRRHPINEDVYGITLWQRWRSDLYSDEGYLFILVHYDEGVPVIYVRTWQPYEYTSAEEVFGLGHFRIY